MILLSETESVENLSNYVNGTENFSVIHMEYFFLLRVDFHFFDYITCSNVETHYLPLS